jgi:hypothetical protein
VYGVHHISHYTFPIQTCQNYLTISITTLFLYKHIKIASHYLHMICIWCPPYQSLHISYTNMSKLSYHINHNTFPIQTCQNCVTPFAYDLYMVSTISITTLFLHKHVKIASHHLYVVSTISVTTHFLYKHVKIASHHLYVVSTISITTPLLYKHVRIILPYQSLRFSYTNMSKSSYTMCIQCPPYQSLHLSFLYKHVKIASHFPSVHYINITALFLHKHVKIFLESTISITTLFLHKHVKTASHHLYMVDTISVTTLSYTNCVHYTFPSQQSTRSITTHCLYKIAKIASIYNCPLYPSLHFATETCKNCVHMQVSTISTTTAHSYTNM